MVTIDGEGMCSGRPRNILNPTNEWKVLGGFVNFILYQVFLKNMPFNTCGQSFLDMVSMFEDNTGIFMSMDGSNHDSA